MIATPFGARPPRPRQRTLALGAFALLAFLVVSSARAQPGVYAFVQVNQFSPVQRSDSFGTAPGCVQQAATAERVSVTAAACPDLLHAEAQVEESAVGVPQAEAGLEAIPIEIAESPALLALVGPDGTVTLRLWFHVELLRETEAHGFPANSASTAGLSIGIRVGDVGGFPYGTNGLATLQDSHEGTPLAIDTGCFAGIALGGATFDLPVDAPLNPTLPGGRKLAINAILNASGVAVAQSRARTRLTVTLPESRRRLTRLDGTSLEDLGILHRAWGDFPAEALQAGSLHMLPSPQGFVVRAAGTNTPPGLEYATQLEPPVTWKPIAGSIRRLAAVWWIDVPWESLPSGPALFFRSRVE